MIRICTLVMHLPIPVTTTAIIAGPSVKKEQIDSLIMIF